MDFRRIEMIFLFVFIALDIFLFTSYTQAHNVIMNDSEYSVVNEMKSSNISTGKLSNKKSKGYYLSERGNDKLNENKEDLKNQNVAMNGDILVSELKTPIDVKNGNVIKKLESYVRKPGNVLYGTQYEYNKVLSNDKNYIFTQVGPFGSIYNERSQIVFTRQNNYITSYQQRFINSLSILREEQETISEREAVEDLYTASEIPNNTKITHTAFAYSKLLTAKGSTIYIPAWYIVLQNKSTDNKSIKIINAFNGTLLKNQEEDI